MMTVCGRIYVTLEVETEGPREAARAFIKKFADNRPEPGFVDEEFWVQGVCTRCKEPIMEGDESHRERNEDGPQCGCLDYDVCGKCHLEELAREEAKRSKLRLSAVAVEQPTRKDGE